MLMKIETLCAPQRGTVCTLEKLPDPVFREKILGDGFAVLPIDGDVVSPVDGTVIGVQETRHAVSLSSVRGLEILVHVGINTVSMKGEGFTVYVRPGESVRVGQRLLHVDLPLIRGRGCGTECVVLIINMEKTEALSMETAVGTEVPAGKVPVMKVTLWETKKQEVCV